MAKRKKSKPPIKIIKLKNGEVIIGGISVSKKTTTLYRPMSLYSIPIIDKNGIPKEETSMYMKNWVDASTSLIYTIPSDFVLVVGEPDSDSIKLYNHAILSEDMLFTDEYLAEVHIEMQKSGYTGPGPVDLVDQSFINEDGIDFESEDGLDDNDSNDDETIK